MNWDLIVCLLAAMFAADGVIGLVWGRKLQGFFGKINVRLVALLELIIAVALLLIRFGISRTV